MTIREYINKNLTGLNWNILPQIFESEGVELTEEIERYLRETPKNTNWNVFGSLDESESKERITIFNQLIEFHDNDYGFPSEITEDLNIPDTEYLIVTLSNNNSNSEEYILPKIIVMDSVIAYGEAGDTGPIFTNYPCFILPSYEGVNYSTFYIPTPGFWRIKIEVEE